MKKIIFIYAFLVTILLNITITIFSIYLSVFGINFSMEYLEMEIKNYLNTYVEKERYIINYDNNREYLDIIFDNIIKDRIEFINKGIGISSPNNWEKFVDSIQLNNDNIYYYYYEILKLPTNFVKYCNKKLFNSNDFLINYSKNNFYDINLLMRKDSLINSDYWYNSITDGNYYEFLYESMYIFLNSIEQLMLKQIYEKNIIFYDTNISISDVINIQRRKETIKSYKFYKVEFNKYIYNSYLNYIFLIIIIPITWFFIILFSLLKFIFIYKKREFWLKKFQFLYSFKYI